MGCPFSLQINEQAQAVTVWHWLFARSAGLDGLTGSKHSITPTLLPLLSEGSMPRRLARSQLCEPWALLCPWHWGLLAPAAPCHAAARPSAPCPNPPHQALLCPHRSEPTEELSTHISLPVFQCYHKQWEAGVVSKEGSTRSLANPDYWAAELLDTNALGGHLVLLHYWDTMAP